MATINENYLKLQAGYLFPEIGRRMRAFKAANPKADVISMGIGDVTQPIVPEVVDAMKDAADKMGTKQGLHGYGPEQGYEFLRTLISDNDYKSRGVDIDIDEIFISDGAKCDTGNMQEIFGIDNVVAVTDPVYPVYVDTNVMAGRTGNAKENGQYGGIVYMPVNPENNFSPALPEEKVDLIYLCYPNNPTGAVIDRHSLAKWVNFAKENKAIILYDAAYEAYISDPDIPHSIYEIEGAKEVAIEFRSFSKTAGFTGVRCGFSVVPKQLKAYTKTGDAASVNQIWSRRHCTKFNGASFISQAAAAAVYSDRGKKQVKDVIEIYMNNAAKIRKALSDLGYTIFGGTNAPYIWMKTPNSMTSWDFFDMLLEKTHLVGTPGSGFGLAGEGYFRLTAFGLPENVDEAMKRFAKL